MCTITLFIPFPSAINRGGGQGRTIQISIQEEIVVEAKPEAQPEDISDNEGYYIVVSSFNELWYYSELNFYIT